MFKSKKAVISASFLVGAIITIVSFLVIAPLAARMVGDDETKIEKLCQESVAFRAKWVMNLDVPIGKAELKMPVFCKVIDKDLEGNKEELMDQIAQKMARCWWQFNEGRFEEILKGSNFESLFFGRDVTNDCSMCYTLTIEEKEIEDGKITSEEFADYFRKTEYKKAGMTYLEYFQRGGGPGKVGILTPEILPGRVYGVSFLAKANDEKTEWWEGPAKVVGGITFAVLGVVSGGSILIITAAVAGGTAVAAAVINNVKAALYDEANRDVSAIFLDTLASAQKNCFKGDLGGE